MKNVYVIIRYSIVSSVNKAWIISRTDYSQYKENIFHPDRMAVREELFSKYTLPALSQIAKNSPEDINFQVFIITSRELPEHNKDNLYSMVSNLDNIKIFEIEEDQNYIGYMEKAVRNDLEKCDNIEGVCATVRLDDDDALSDDFLIQLEPYLSDAFSDYCVSFTKGYRAYHFPDGHIKYEVSYTPMIAQGLAYILKYDLMNKERLRTIYSIGDHKKVDRKRPVILDSRSIGYIWAVHADSDMSIRDKKRIDAGKDFSTLSEVRKSFSWIN